MPARMQRVFWVWSLGFGAKGLRASIGFGTPPVLQPCGPYPDLAVIQLLLLLLSNNFFDY